MKVLIVGANGQLGSDLVIAYEKSGHTVVPVNHAQCDVTDQQQVLYTVSTVKPDVVVNTSAMHNLDACEANPSLAYAVNIVGPRNLAEACDFNHARFVHFSTDYVFDGNTADPYVETDLPNPLNIYGQSKYKGEKIAMQTLDTTAIIRTSGLYGANPCRAKNGLNFVKLMLKLGKERDEVRVVDDEILSPTSTWDLAKQCVLITEANLVGVIHATSRGQCSWYEFAKQILSYGGSQDVFKLRIARPGEFPNKVARPSYSVLENARLEAITLNAMPDWRDSLDKYLYSLNSSK